MRRPLSFKQPPFPYFNAMSDSESPVTYGLYITLHLRPNEPNAPHWCLWWHSVGAPGAGQKWQIRNLGPGWIADHGKTSNALNSFLLCGSIQIATVPEDYLKQLNDIICATDPQLNDYQYTCRTYVLGAIQRLMQSGFVRCNSLTQLEQEAFAFAAAQYVATADNRQPRPIVQSSLCYL